MQSRAAKSWHNKDVSASRIPDEVKAAIEGSWPDGLVEEFDTDESGFHDIHAALERDLQMIPGASLLWQTPPKDESIYRDLDDGDYEPPFEQDFQSYHVFFLSPPGGEFEFQTETEGEEAREDLEDPVDPLDATVTVTYPGKGQYGCTAMVSLAAPFAAVGFCEYAQFDDGSDSIPDPANFVHFTETGEPVDDATHYREVLGEDTFRDLENLRERIAAVLAKHGLAVLDQPILDLPLPELRSDGDLFLDGTLSVKDAFFFRGV
jgi:hypothetical protein